MTATRRSTGIIGLGVVALQLTGAGLTLTAGRSPLTPAEVTPYLATNSSALLAATFGALAALTAFIAFLAGLRDTVRGTGSGVAELAPVLFGSGIVGVAVSYVATALVASATLFAREGRLPEVVAIVFETGSAMLVLAGLPLGLAIAVSAFALGRSGLISSPLVLVGWVAAGLAVGSAVASFAIVDPSSRVAVGALGVAALITWVAAMSVAMIATSGRVRAA